MPNTVGGASRVRYSQTSQWEVRWGEDAKRAQATEVYFGSDFDIKNDHIEAITTSSFVQSLKKLTFGDTDSGRGSEISDEFIIKLAKAAPQLEETIFESATKLTDLSLLALTEHCPHIKAISITGHDKCRGGIKGDSLTQIATDPTLAPDLQKLYLMDQSLSAKALNALSKARPRLTITECKTVGDGPAAQFVASLIGGSTSTI